MSSKYMTCHTDDIVVKVMTNVVTINMFNCSEYVVYDSRGQPRTSIKVQYIEIS